jgi:hypothetical protein
MIGRPRIARFYKILRRSIRTFHLVNAIAGTVGGEVAAKLIARVKLNGSFGYTAVLPESGAAQNPAVKITRVLTKPDPSKEREFCRRRAGWQVHSALLVAGCDCVTSAREVAPSESCCSPSVLDYSLVLSVPSCRPPCRCRIASGVGALVYLSRNERSQASPPADARESRKCESVGAASPGHPARDTAK